MTEASRIRLVEVMECTIGGTRRHIGELTVGLAARGFDVTLFASAERDATFREDLARIGASGVNVVEIPMRREISPVADLRHQAALVSAFARGRFDVVHTHSSKAGALGRIAARVAARAARIVHTPHTFAFNFAEQFSERKRKIFLGVERCLGRVTDRMIHVSESERREGIALAIVSPERAIVIENGVDLAAFDGVSGDRIRAELGIDATVPLIGAVGLLNEAKGHPWLIDAMVEVRRRVPEARCVIVGEGRLRGELERRIAGHGLGDHVRLLGYRRDVPEILAALDVFAMPSLWEGMPYGVLEAMASRRPVVATDVNGCRDLVADGATGLLVPPRAAEPLAAAIVRLLTERDLARRVAVAGRDLVARRYSRDDMLDRYARLFRDLVAATPRAGGAT